MKVRIISLFLAMMMALALVSCGTKPSAPTTPDASASVSEPAVTPDVPEVTPDVSEPEVTPEPDESQPIGMASPVTIVTAEELLNQTGLILTAPEDAEDVTYAVIDMDDEEPIGEMSFTYQGVSYFLRAQSTPEVAPYDISGLNYQWETSETNLYGFTAITASNDEAGFLAWINIVESVNYTLGTNQSTDTDALRTMAELVYSNEDH